MVREPASLQGGVLTASRTDTNVTANVSVTANFAINSVRARCARIYSTAGISRDVRNVFGGDTHKEFIIETTGMADPGPVATTLADWRDRDRR